MKNFYVLRRNEDGESMTYYSTAYDAEKAARDFTKNTNYTYVEYGVVNYDGWQNSCLAIIKNEVE